MLARYAQAYAREVGVAEGRVRAWVAYMIMAGALERATGAASDQLAITLAGHAAEFPYGLPHRAFASGTAQTAEIWPSRAS